jgi:hypothetical protein
VLSRRETPFPFEAVRDLLGVVRAMYAAAKESGAGRTELARISAVGRDLSKALDIAASTREGTVGHAAAWKRAEDATRRVGDLVDALTPAEPLIGAARSRVTGLKRAFGKKHNER